MRRDAVPAERMRRSLHAFAQYFWPRMTGLPWPDNTATRALCAALQAVADGRIWRLLVAISPGIGKSTMLALYAAWRLARRADWRALHAMAAQADANRESNRVRRLVEHPDFRRLFPDVTLDPREQDVKSWATTAGGRYFANGTDAAITSKRVLELVVDDPMNAIDRYSKATRDETWTWLDEGAMSRLDGDRAPVIIVAQRLDKDDIHARCLASGQEWVILEPAAARDGRGLELRDHAGEIVWTDERAPEELIAPQMLSREKLMGFSKSVRTIQYQQRPDEDAGGAISRAAWRFHAPDGANPNAVRPLGCAKPGEAPTIATPDQFDATVISIDPTFGGTKTSNDFCAMHVWSARGAGRFLRDRWKKRSKQLEQQAQVKLFREKYPDAIILIEKAAGGSGMAEQLEADGIEGIELVTVGSHTGGKSARLDVVSPTIEQGFAFIPIGMLELQDFVDELAGMTVHDDDQDAASQALTWLNLHCGDGANETERWRTITTGFVALSRAAEGYRNPSPADIAQQARHAAELPSLLALAEQLDPQLQAELDGLSRARQGMHPHWCSMWTTAKVDERLTAVERGLLLCRRIRAGIAKPHELGELRRFAANEQLEQAEQERTTT